MINTHILCSRTKKKHVNSNWHWNHDDNNVFAWGEPFFFCCWHFARGIIALQFHTNTQFYTLNRIKISVIAIVLRWASEKSRIFFFIFSAGAFILIYGVELLNSESTPSNDFVEFGVYFWNEKRIASHVIYSRQCNVK